MVILTGDTCRDVLTAHQRDFRRLVGTDSSHPHDPHERNK